MVTKVSDALLIKVMNQKKLNDKEIEKVLCFVRDSAKLSVISECGESALNTTCLESSYYIGYYLKKLKIPYSLFNTKLFITDELEHYFGICGFNGLEGPVWYLIDITYSQFCKYNYCLYVNGEKTYIKAPGRNMDIKSMLDIEKKGFFKLTDLDLYNYVNAFIVSCSEFKDIDRGKVFDTLGYDLHQCGITVESFEKSKFKKNK